MRRPTFLLGAFALAIASTLTALPIDEQLFISPSLTEIAGKLSFDAAVPLSGEKKASYEYAYSLNIGQNLPSTTHFVSQEAARVVGLGAHLSHMADSLAPKGRAIIAVPASYGVLFTDGKLSEEQARNQVAAALAKIGNSDDKQLIINVLSGLDGILRATFVQREGKLYLVMDDKVLSLGEKVWRKTPEGVCEEIFHSEEEYLVAIRSAGLHCEEIKRPCFFGEVKWKAFNSSRKEGEPTLGAAYKEHNPFTLFIVTKSV